MSSLRIAAMMDDMDWCGSTRLRAAAIIEATRGPFMPNSVKNSTNDGVRRNGTGWLLTNSPDFTTYSIEEKNEETFQRFFFNAVSKNGFEHHENKFTKCEQEEQKRLVMIVNFRKCMKPLINNEIWWSDSQGK
jgi:hypothetical protein